MDFHQVDRINKLLNKAHIKIETCQFLRDMKKYN